MASRKEDIILVRDPKGETFEVTRRNATDLVQHKGWKIIGEGEDEETALATKGRKKRPRGEKVKAAQEAAKASAKKTAPVLPQPEVEVDGDEPTFDEQQAAGDLGDELDDLESEESERGKP